MRGACQEAQRIQQAPLEYLIFLQYFYDALIPNYHGN